MLEITVTLGAAVLAGTVLAPRLRLATPPPPLCVSRQIHLIDACGAGSSHRPFAPMRPVSSAWLGAVIRKACRTSAGRVCV